jgi:metal-responsive CopG/Arc/MetJ family transcriptional regulator
MDTHRAHIVIPQALVREIDLVVGKRGRSNFLVEAASRELKRLRQMKALKAAAGCWKDHDHPELKEGTAHWVRSLRRQDEKRLHRFQGR